MASQGVRCHRAERLGFIKAAGQRLNLSALPVVTSTQVQSITAIIITAIIITGIIITILSSCGWSRTRACQLAGTANATGAA